MRRIASLLAVVVLAVGLGGCPESRSVLQGGTSLTAEINNPVSRNTLAQIESTYGLVLSGAVAYRRLPLCRAGESATVSNVCAQRNVILILQRANTKARFALLQARRFVREHPTVSAVDFIQLARQAVAEFQAVAVANGIGGAAS